MQRSMSQHRVRAPSGVRSERPASLDSCLREFLRLFPEGFYDETYLAWERNYKWDAHRRWIAQLDEGSLLRMIDLGRFEEVAMHAVRIESRTNLLFSFEKMALRDAVRTRAGARLFATALYAFLHGPGTPQDRFDDWCGSIASLPRKQTRVLTWPLANRVRFSRPTKQAFFPEAECNTSGGRQMRFGIQVLIHAVVGRIRRRSQICPRGETRSRGSETARSDRCPILHLGNGIRRVRVIHAHGHSGRRWNQ